MLKTGATDTAEVYARRWWNKTEIVLEAGHRYQLLATGHWWDSFIRCGPAGYSCSLLRYFDDRRRVPLEPWFKLIGSIDFAEDRMFSIGVGCVLVAPVTGNLTCFANDLRRMRWNNWGSIQLKVERIS